MILLRLLLVITMILSFFANVSSSDQLGNSFIRVLIGDFSPTKTDMEKIKKVKAKAIVSGSSYLGEIEIWKGSEGYYLVNVVALEDYVKGVVSSEVGINWPEEALKAQAVLARTYALTHIIRNRNKNFYDVTSSVFHQVYKGVEGSETVEKAVNDTQGEIITFNKEPIMAFYHACSVGKTEDAKDVFGSDQPYLRAVEVPFTPSPYTFWERKITFETLQKVLSINKILNVEIQSLTDTGRVRELKFFDGKNHKVIKATELRRILNWSLLPSTMIKNIRIEQDGLVFEGHGYGHGVGMCQWCAFQMAQDGKNYREILQYFYPGTDILKINDIN